MTTNNDQYPNGNWIDRNMVEHFSEEDLAGAAVAAHPTTRQARTLTEEQIQYVIRHVRNHANAPLSDELKVVLSFYAGLRACEISGLPVTALLDAQGRVGEFIRLTGGITKGGKARQIPMHPYIQEAAQRFRTHHPDLDFVCFSQRFTRIKHQKPNALVVWFGALYRAVGFEGCSSHSGRRTFLTNLARMVNEHGMSLKDVQLLAGHARLDTTERYIDPVANTTSLIHALGKPSSETSTTPRPGA